MFCNIFAARNDTFYNIICTFAREITRFFKI